MTELLLWHWSAEAGKAGADVIVPGAYRLLLANPHAIVQARHLNRRLATVPGNVDGA